MNEINVCDELNGLPKISDLTNQENALHARLILAKTIMKQYATKHVREHCNCCTCNAKRFVDLLESEGL